MGLTINKALANAQLVDLKDNFTGALLYIYKGTPPANAEAALTGDAVLLCTVSGNGDGSPLLFAANPVDGTIEKDATQTWQGTAVADGDATFCRFQMPADTGGTGVATPRLQGDVGTAGRFLNLTNGVTFAAGAVKTVQHWSLTQPTA